uniref:Programmed cell death 1 n=1 Tax=Otolemur garnettii TaxID=30611 RepID=H0WU04_OTOGA
MWTPQVPWPVVWAVLQLGWRPGWLLEESRAVPGICPSFSPARLTVSEGASATFTCSLASMSEDFVLNWYRMSPSNQTYKLAAFPRDHRQDPRFQVTKLPNGHDFSMSIVATQRNDSGIYLCGAISLPPTAQITESPPAELTVTEKDVESPTSHPSPSPRPGGQFQNLVVVVTSVLVGVPVLLLLAWVLTTIRPMATQGAGGGARSADQTLKEDPSAMPAFTVDYGELDFPNREKTPEPPAPLVSEQTEYATIVFPNGLGISSPGHRGSADSLQDPWPLRLEDGHCSWPL